MIGTAFAEAEGRDTGANHVVFNSRTDAGILLAKLLTSYQGLQVLILGLARGGVAVAEPVAQALHAPLDVLVVRKLASAYNAEYALGAVAPDNVCVVHWAAAHKVGADEDEMSVQIQKKSQEIRALIQQYRKGKKPLNVRDKTVIIVDDGAATGTTMEVAIRWVRTKHAKKIIVALPVASEEATKLLRPESDECIVYKTEDNLMSVGQYYSQFPQVSDEEVIELLRKG